MALPSLPFSASLSDEDEASANQTLEYVLRHATRAFVEKVMHNLNNFEGTGAEVVAFRTTLFGTYLPAMLAEEVARSFIEDRDSEAGDFDRLYNSAEEPVTAISTYSNVSVSDTAPITNPVANI